MKPTNLNAKNNISDYLLHHTCRALLWVTFAWHSSKTQLKNTLLRHSYVKLLSGTLVGRRPYRALLCETLEATLVRHFCLKFLCDVFVGSLARHFSKRILWENLAWHSNVHFATLLRGILADTVRPFSNNFVELPDALPQHSRETLAWCAFVEHSWHSCGLLRDTPVGRASRILHASLLRVRSAKCNHGNKVVSQAYLVTYPCFLTLHC